MLTKIKLAIYLAAFAAILGSVYWFNGVLYERTKLKAEKVINLQAIEELTQEKKDNLQQQIKDNENAIIHLHKLEELQRDKDKLNSDLANNVKRVYVNAVCPKQTAIESAEPNTGAPVSEAPQLTRAAEEGVADIYYGIDYNEELMANLQARVIEDYENCGNKLEQVK